MTKPILDSLNLVANDVPATLAFYRLLGLEIPAEAVWGGDGGHHVGIPDPGRMDMDVDSVRLARVYNASWRRADQHPTVIGFRVASREEVDVTFARLTAAGYVGLQEPYDAFWGARYAIVEDPDGRHVGIMSAPDDAHRGAPPDL